MTDYIKRMRGRAGRSNIVATLLWLILAVVFLGLLITLTVPMDSAVYENYNDIQSAKGRAFRVRIDAEDVMDYLTEERTLADHYVLFLMQEDGSTFNVILDEKKLDALAAEGSLTTTLYRLSGDDADGYSSSIQEYFNSAGMDGDTLAIYQLMANSPYYTTPFNQWTNLLFLGAGLAALIAFLVCLSRSIAAFRGGGSYRKDMDFITGQTGLSQREVEDRVNASLDDPATAPYVGKFLACNRDWILCAAGQKLRLMRTQDVVWVHRKTVTTRTYGIKTGSSHTVLLYAQNSYEPANVPFKKEADADMALFELEKLCVNAFVGYDQDMANQAKKKNYPALVAAWNAQQKQRDNAPAADNGNNAGF